VDSIDIELLRLLDTNSRSTASDLSKKVNLSLPAVSERMKKLEASGMIEHFSIRINREAQGFDMLAFVFINIDHEKYIDSARNAIIAFEEVLECHHMAGEYDYLVKVLLKDTKELESFISERLKKVVGISKSNTMICLSSIKDKINRMEA